MTTSDAYAFGWEFYFKLSGVSIKDVPADRKTHWQQGWDDAAKQSRLLKHKVK